MTADEALSRPLALVVAFAVVGLLPLLFMSLTAFVKISTVLSILRSAIGTQQAPSNTVVLALAAALTLLVMAPVGDAISDRVVPVLEAGTGDARRFAEDLVVAVREPLRGFLRANASERERERFFELARASRPEPARDAVQRDDLSVVIPAFLVSELLQAFVLGFAIFLPFLLVDLVVANVLVALGIPSLNPTQVSLPFKLLLFVLADGWSLLSQTLVTGYLPG